MARLTQSGVHWRKHAKQTFLCLKLIICNIYVIVRELIKSTASDNFVTPFKGRMEPISMAVRAPTSQTVQEIE